MTLFPVLVDVHHKEQLLTREEAEDVATQIWRWDNIWWVQVAVTKNGDTAARIADILDKYGFKGVAQQIRGKCVYVRLCVHVLYRIPSKGHSCISCILCMCVYIDHHGRVLVVVIICSK